MPDIITTDLGEGIAQITLSHPERRNALTAAMWTALPEAVERVSEARVVVVRGEGEHFAAGADISEFETLYSTPDSAAAISADIQRAFEALARCPVPTVAAIGGACVGGGLGLALCCDVRVADTAAVFAITPAKLGLVYPFADIARLADAVGVARARDILLSARKLDAHGALEAGLVHRVVEPGELHGEVQRYARGVAKLSPESLRVTKAMIDLYARGQREATPDTDAMFLAGFSSRDFGEGFRAFLAKRPPEFDP